MASGTSFCFLMVCFLLCSSEAQEKIPAELGKNVILPCNVPNKYNIKNIAVEWTRPGLDPEYVLFYRDGHLDPHNQHESYQNRVDLQDKDMKDGDVSLILMNVKMEDRGTYECYVFEKRENELINNITLEVRPPGEKFGGDKGGAIAGSVVNEILLFAVISVGFLISRQHLKRN